MTRIWRHVVGATPVTQQIQRRFVNIFDLTLVAHSEHHGNLQLQQGAWSGDHRGMDYTRARRRFYCLSTGIESSKPELFLKRRLLANESFDRGYRTNWQSPSH